MRSSVLAMIVDVCRRKQAGVKLAKRSAVPLPDWRESSFDKECVEVSETTVYIPAVRDRPIHPFQEAKRRQFGLQRFEKENSCARFPCRPEQVDDVAPVRQMMKHIGDDAEVECTAVQNSGRLPAMPLGSRIFTAAMLDHVRVDIDAVKARDPGGDEPVVLTVSATDLTYTFIAVHRAGEEIPKFEVIAVEKDRFHDRNGRSREKELAPVNPVASTSAGR